MSKEMTETNAPTTMLSPATFKEAQEYAVTIAKSGLVPAAYKNKPDDVLVAMQMGAEVGLAPMQALQSIAVINGRPSLWGDALVALCQAHPKFGGIKETFDEKTMTATCAAYRKGSDPAIQSFSQQDATTAGLWGTNTWKKYPKRMLQQRARGFALRDAFADALKGLISADEAQDYPTPRNISSEGSHTMPESSDGVAAELSGRQAAEEVPFAPEAKDPQPVMPSLDMATFPEEIEAHIDMETEGGVFNTAFNALDAAFRTLPSQPKAVWDCYLASRKGWAADIPEDHMELFGFMVDWFLAVAEEAGYKQPERKTAK